MEGKYCMTMIYVFSLHSDTMHSTPLQSNPIQYTPVCFTFFLVNTLHFTSSNFRFHSTALLFYSLSSPSLSYLHSLSSLCSSLQPTPLYSTSLYSTLLYYTLLHSTPLYFTQLLTSTQHFNIF